MTTYRNIHGRPIQAVTTDPTGDITEGQVWYNTASDTFKTVLLNQAWSSSSPMITARRAMNNGFGAQNSGVAVGGYSTTYHNNTEEYNGTGWVSSGNYPASLYYIQTSGTETAGLAVGGGDPVVTTVNEYNGSSWTSANGLPTATKGMSRAGTQTASIFGGGFQPSTVGTCYLYDGTNWTSAPALNTARGSGAGSGAQTDAVFYGGGGTGTNAQTEEFNGSSWSEQNDLPTAKQNLGFANDTTSTSAIGSGGYTPPNTRTTTCFKYDGTSWSTIPSLSTAKAQGASGAGTADGAYFAGGTQTGTAVNTTEEYNSSANVITPSSFAAGGNMPVAKRVGGSSTGGSIVALTFGGDTLPMAAGQPQVNTTEEYDGSSWTSGGNLGNNVSRCAGSGTQTAGLGAGGYSTSTPWQTPNAAYIANAFEYDGSSWTNVTALPITMDGHTAFGVQTAAVYGAGSQGPNPSPGPAADNRSKNTHHYDGTNWTSGGAFNDFHSDTDASAGTQTAGIVFGGYNGNPLPSTTTSLEEYNGSSWTSAVSGLQAISIGGGFGTQSLFLAAGGQNAPIPSSPGTTGYSLNSFLYNGTSMVTDASIATRRVIVGCDGVVGTAAGMICGGSTSYSSRTTATEEYTQGSTALNLKTLTQS